jgi:hypothetical protein
MVRYTRTPGSYAKKFPGKYAYRIRKPRAPLPKQSWKSTAIDRPQPAQFREPTCASSRSWSPKSAANSQCRSLAFPRGLASGRSLSDYGGPLMGQQHQSGVTRSTSALPLVVVMARLG